MNDIIRFFFTNEGHYTNPLERRRARIVLVMLWAIALIWSVTMVSRSLLPTDSVGLQVTISALVGIVIVPAFALLKQRALNWAIYLLVGFLVAASAGVLMFVEEVGGFSLAILLLPLVAAGVLLPRGGIIGVGVGLAALIFLSVFLDPNGFRTLTDQPIPSALRIIFVLTLSTTMLAINTGRARPVVNAVADDNESLRQLLNALGGVSPSTELSDLYQQVIRAVRTHFDFNEVQLYLLDDQNKLAERIRSGMRTMEQLAPHEQLSLGDANVLSEAARIRRPIQVSLQDANSRTKHLLPSMTHGLALPILNKDTPLGVIDVQNVSHESLSQSEIDVLQTIANQLGKLIALLRHVDAVEKDLSENENLVNRLQAQVSASQSRRQRFIGDAWDDYIKHQGQDLLGFDWRGGDLRRAEDMPAAMRKTLKNGEPYVTVENDEKLINVPIIVRGDVLGAMSFAVPLERTVTERQLELAKTISVRLGSALESNRLLEQTQEQAQRERQASAVSNLLISATDVDSLLRLAADSLNDTLGAVQTQIIVEPNTFTGGNTRPTSNSNNGDAS